jgi:hypothetical protein
VRASSGKTARDSGVVSVSGISPGAESWIDVVSSNGKQLRIVVLTAEEAEDAWKVRIGGADHLLISAQDFFADSDAAAGRVWLRSRGTPEFAFSITPPLKTKLIANPPLKRTGKDAEVDSFTATAIPRNLGLKFIQIQPAGEVPPVKAGPALGWRPKGVAQAPTEADFSPAARWSITLPPDAMSDLSGLFLEVDYIGDVAHLSAAHQLLTDDFYNGYPWLVGLGRFLNPQGASTFELSILPLRKDAPVYFELPKPLSFPPNGQIDRLDGLRLVPEYQLIFNTAGKDEQPRGSR